jgi:hypothetical protein
MAVHKVTRSNPPKQTTPKRPDHQLKADFFEALRHLNRGYGVALAALDKLEAKDRQHAPAHLSRYAPAGLPHPYRRAPRSGQP